MNACSGSNASNEAPPLEGAKIGGAFELVDENGDTFNSDALNGRYSIVYFGYTYCPDVCPVDLRTTMQGLKLAEQERPELAEEIQPIFVTIDPERDTPDVVKAYTDNFHPDLIGLTGSDEQIADAAGKYLIPYAKREVEGMSDYLMDHGRQTYLMGPEGQPIALLPQDGTPEQVSAEILKWVK